MCFFYNKAEEVFIKTSRVVDGMEKYCIRNCCRRSSTRHGHVYFMFLLFFPSCHSFFPPLPSQTISFPIFILKNMRFLYIFFIFFFRDIIVPKSKATESPATEDDGDDDGDEDDDIFYDSEDGQDDDDSTDSLS